jgi:putative endonuclease
VDRHERGRRAEDRAAAHLVENGFAILGRNVRLGALEIDILADDGERVLIVEVRARGDTSWERAAASVSRAKQQTLARAARRLWREQIRAMRPPRRLRFDVITVDANDHLDWFPAAFTA